MSEKPFDLIVTDIRMPNVDGLELIEKLNNENIKTPVITITGYHSRETMLDSVKKGCSAYLIKPLNMEKLLDEISKNTTSEAPRLKSGVSL